MRYVVERNDQAYRSDFEVYEVVDTHHPQRKQVIASHLSYKNAALITCALNQFDLCGYESPIFDYHETTNFAELWRS